MIKGQFGGMKTNRIQLVKIFTFVFFSGIIILSQMFINKVFFYGVYNSACFTVAETVYTIALVSVIYNQRCKATLKKALIIVFSLFYLLSFVGFIVFLPQYTMSTALDKIKHEQPLLYEVKVNEKYPTMELSSSNGLVDSVYCISAYSDDSAEIIYFNPTDGSYNVVKK